MLWHQELGFDSLEATGPCHPSTLTKANIMERTPMKPSEAHAEKEPRRVA